MEELPALNLWECVVDVLALAGGNSSHVRSRVQNLTTDSDISFHAIRYVPSNMVSTSQRVRLLV